MVMLRMVHCWVTIPTSQICFAGHLRSANIVQPGTEPAASLSHVGRSVVVDTGPGNSRKLKVQGGLGNPHGWIGETKTWTVHKGLKFGCANLVCVQANIGISDNFFSQEVTVNNCVSNATSKVASCVYIQ